MRSMPDYRRRATKEAMSLRFDFNGIFANGSGETALSVAAIEGLEGRLAGAHELVVARRAAGELPALAWVSSRSGVSEIKEVAESVRQECKTLVVVGTGGTALTAQVLVRCLGSTGVRVLFADAVDPDHFGPLLEELDLATTVFNVVSKSGETPETLAQFLVVRDLLLRRLGAVDYVRHLVVTTDADQGALRQIVHDEGFRSLPIPPGVSDRFAAVSPASLFPAAIAGVRVEDVLAGASWMETRCQGTSPWKNPALLLAAVLLLASEQRTRRQLLFLPLCRRLKALAEWSAELYAETLGHGDATEPVSTPPPLFPASTRKADAYLLAEVLAARPQETFAVILGTIDHGRELSVASSYQDLEAVAYLGGHGLGDMVAARRDALETLLRKRQCSFLTTTWPQVNAFTVGQWMYGIELTLWYLAELLHVDTTAQPAADECRRLLYGALGRKGFEKEHDEIEAVRDSKRPEWIL